MNRRLIESSPLPQNLKKILIMRDIEKRSNGEIAKLLGKHPSTTSGLYSEGKKKMEAWLQGQGPAAQMKREEGLEQAEVFRLLLERVPLAEVTIRTGIPAERVSELTDEFVKLVSKQADLDRKLSTEGTNPPQESKRSLQTGERSDSAPVKLRLPRTYCKECGGDKEIMNASLVLSKKGRLVVKGVCVKCKEPLESSAKSDIALLKELQ